MANVGRSDYILGGQNAGLDGAASIRRLANGQIIIDTPPDGTNTDRFGKLDPAKDSFEAQRNQAVPAFRFLLRKFPAPGRLYEESSSYRSQYVYNDNNLHIAGHSLNQNREFVGPSGIQISAKDYEQLIKIQEALVQDRNDFIAGNLNPGQFQRNREDLEDAMIKIFDQAEKNSPRQKEIDKISAEVDKYRQRIKQGEILSTQELRQFVEHEVHLSRLREARAREQSMMSLQLRQDYYNLAGLLDNQHRLDLHEKWQLADLVEIQSILNQPVHCAYSGIDTVGNLAQRSVLDEKIKLEQEIKAHGSSPAREAKLHRLNYRQFIEVEGGAYDPPLRDNETLRNDFLRKALTKSELPCEEFLDYVMKYASSVSDPQKQEKLGIAIELAKELRLAKNIRGKHLTDKQQNFISIASELMGISTSDLRNVDFSNTEMQVTGFRKSKTSGASFKDTKFLQGTDFSEAELTTTTNVNFGPSSLKIDPKWITDFTRANLSHAYFMKSKGRFTIFADANLTAATLTGSDFRNADFTKANLARAELHDSNIQHGNFIDTNLSGVRADKTNLSGAFFQNARFSNFNTDENGHNTYGPKTNFAGAAIRGSTGVGANFTTCDFTEALIEGSQFETADFQEATLTKVVIISSEFKSARFSRANLTDASIMNSTFETSGFFGANLQGANLCGSSFSKHCDFSRANLTSASLQNVRSSNSNFSNATMIGANLIDSSFQNSDFRGTQLDGANLQGANLSSIQINSSTSFKGVVYDDETSFPGIDNNNEAARAAFAERHGMVHINQMVLFQKAEQAKRMASELEKRFNEIAENQGWANGLYDGAKNNSETTNAIVNGLVFGPTLGGAPAVSSSSGPIQIFDKTKGSDAVKRVIAQLKREAQELETLAAKGYTKANAQKINDKFKELFGDNMHQIFNTPPEERMKVLQDYLQDPSRANKAALKQQVLSDFALMGGKFKDALLEIDKYITSQDNFGEGCSMTIGIGSMLVCIALAGPTGGASLYAAPLVAAGATTGFKASNGKGDGTAYSGEELAVNFAVETVVGYATLPTGGLAKAGVTSGGKYIISKVGSRYVARLVTSRGGQMAGRFIANSAAHATAGAAYATSHRTLMGMYHGEDFFTALNHGLEHAPQGAITGLVLGHAIDGAHRGFSNALARSRGSTSRLPVELQYARSGHEVPIPEFIRSSNAFNYYSRHHGTRIKIVVDTNLPQGINARAHVTEAGGQRTTIVRVRPEVADGLAKGRSQARKIISEEIQMHGNQSMIDPLVNGKTMPREEYLARRAFQELTAKSATAKRFGEAGNGSALAELKRLIDSGRYSEALNFARNNGLTIADVAVFNGDYNVNVSPSRTRLVQRNNNSSETIATPEELIALREEGFSTKDVAEEIMSQNGNELNNARMTDGRTGAKGNIGVLFDHIARGETLEVAAQKAGFASVDAAKARIGAFSKEAGVPDYSGVFDPISTTSTRTNTVNSRVRAKIDELNAKSPVADKATREGQILDIFDELAPELKTHKGNGGKIKISPERRAAISARREAMLKMLDDHQLVDSTLQHLNRLVKLSKKGVTIPDDLLLSPRESQKPVRSDSPNSTPRDILGRAEQMLRNGSPPSEISGFLKLELNPNSISVNLAKINSKKLGISSLETQAKMAEVHAKHNGVSTQFGNIEDLFNRLVNLRSNGVEGTGRILDSVFEVSNSGNFRKDASGFFCEAYRAEQEIAAGKIVYAVGVKTHFDLTNVLKRIKADFPDIEIRFPGSKDNSLHTDLDIILVDPRNPTRVVHIETKTSLQAVKDANPMQADTQRGIADAYNLVREETVGTDGTVTNRYNQ